MAQLVTHLQSIGLEGEAKLICRRIEAVGYYRLSPYWRYYRIIAKQNALRPNTHIDQVWELYTFDRQLRLFALDALERVEVGIRSELVQANVEESGPFGYSQATNINFHHKKLLQEIADSVFTARNDPSRSWLNEAQRHFVSHYSECYWPLWLAAESFSFGDLVTLYKGSSSRVRTAVAQRFGIHHRVLGSWLGALQILRNICAHYGRLWNRHIGVQPQLPERSADWQDPRVGQRGRVFVLFTLLRYLLQKLCPKSTWAQRIHALLKAHPNIPMVELGIVSGWEQHPFWKMTVSTRPTPSPSNPPIA